MKTTTKSKVKKEKMQPIPPPKHIASDIDCKDPDRCCSECGVKKDNKYNMIKKKDTEFVKDHNTKRIREIKSAPRPKNKFDDNFRFDLYQEDAGIFIGRGYDQYAQKGGHPLPPTLRNQIRTAFPAQN